ncbi:winged helix-turn-helix domain-containing protein [Micromonospora sp. NPDC049801]|uniref:GntR family transcriptional regulator n=1 Tax=unclassified Micromonospora TaxID=2617518 RepID=UPI0033DC4295
MSYALSILLRHRRLRPVHVGEETQRGVIARANRNAAGRSAAIAAKIKSGDLKPGEKLPSTRELAESYAVHMNTASRALSLLHDRELITGQPGRGTYVAEHPDR